MRSAGVLDLQQTNLADLDQRRPVGAAGVHRLQQRRGGALHRHVVQHALQHRDRAGVVGVAVEDDAQVFQRPLLVVLAVVLDLRQPETNRDDLALGQHPLEGLVEEPRQIAPAFGLRVEAIQRRLRLAFLRRDLQHPFVGDDGLLGAPELPVGQPRQLQAQLALGPRIARQLGATGEHIVK